MAIAAIAATINAAIAIRIFFLIFIFARSYLFNCCYRYIDNNV